jgi:effector-binding domain-containing protein
MPLTEVGEIVSAPPALGAELLRSYWDRVERGVASQRELVVHITNQLLGGEARLPLPTVGERDIPEQLVLSERRHVSVEQLPGWIAAAMTRLMRVAGRYGGSTGVPFVVYYGDVNEDSDGPAEACVPIDPAEGVADAVVRHEPAHREVYVRLRKSQVAFPQILSAYDGLMAWVATRGLIATGAPREVYFADFLSASPTDEVCDVAVPIGDPVVAAREPAH